MTGITNRDGDEAADLALPGESGGSRTMDTKKLRAFVEIVDRRSITKASETLHIAQPALTLQVQSLEAAFGAQLLIRSRQGIRLTEQGRVLYQFAKLILRQYATAKREARAATEELNGPVYIAMPGSLNLVLAEKLIAMAKARFPGLTLVMSQGLGGALLDEYVNRKFDVVLASAMMDARRLDAVPLLTERLVLFGRAETIGALTEPVAMEDLAEIPLVLPNGANLLRQDIQRAFDRANVRPNVVAELDSSFLLRKAAAEGIAATILPVIAVKDFGESHHVIRAIASPELERTVAVATVKLQAMTRETAAVKALITELITDLVKSGQWEGARLLDDERPC